MGKKKSGAGKKSNKKKQVEDPEETPGEPSGVVDPLADEGGEDVGQNGDGAEPNADTPSKEQAAESQEPATIDDEPQAGMDAEPQCPAESKIGSGEDLGYGTVDTKVDVDGCVDVPDPWTQTAGATDDAAWTGGVEDGSDAVNLGTNEITGTEMREGEQGTSVPVVEYLHEEQDHVSSVEPEEQETSAAAELKPVVLSPLDSHFPASIFQPSSFGFGLSNNTTTTGLDFGSGFTTNTTQSRFSSVNSQSLGFGATTPTSTTPAQQEAVPPVIEFIGNESDESPSGEDVAAIVTEASTSTPAGSDAPITWYCSGTRVSKPLGEKIDRSARENVQKSLPGYVPATWEDWEAHIADQKEASKGDFKQVMCYFSILKIFGEGTVQLISQFTEKRQPIQLQQGDSMIVPAVDLPPAVFKRDYRRRKLKTASKSVFKTPLMNDVLIEGKMQVLAIMSYWVKKHE